MGSVGQKLVGSITGVALFVGAGSGCAERGGGNTTPILRNVEDVYISGSPGGVHKKVGEIVWKNEGVVPLCYLPSGRDATGTLKVQSGQEIGFVAVTLSTDDQTIDNFLPPLRPGEIRNCTDDDLRPSE